MVIKNSNPIFPFRSRFDIKVKLGFYQRAFETSGNYYRSCRSDRYLVRHKLLTIREYLGASENHLQLVDFLILISKENISPVKRDGGAKSNRDVDALHSQLPLP